MQSLFSLPRRFPLYLPNDSRDERLVYRLYFPFFPPFLFLFFFFLFSRFQWRTIERRCFFFFRFRGEYERLARRRTTKWRREEPRVLHGKYVPLCCCVSAVSRFCHAYRGEPRGSATPTPSLMLPSVSPISVSLSLSSLYLAATPGVTRVPSADSRFLILDSSWSLMIHNRSGIHDSSLFPRRAFDDGIASQPRIAANEERLGRSLAPIPGRWIFHQCETPASCSALFGLKCSVSRSLKCNPWSLNWGQFQSATFLSVFLFFIIIFFFFFEDTFNNQFQSWLVDQFCWQIYMHGVFILGKGCESIFFRLEVSTMLFYLTMKFLI